MNAHFAKVHPQQAGDSDFVWRQAVRAKAFDALRGLLPAASLSQRRHLRHRARPTSSC